MISISLPSNVNTFKRPVAATQNARFNIKNSELLQYSPYVCFLIITTQDLYCSVQPSMIFLLLALQLLMSSGLLNNSLPCFSFHSNLTRIPNPHFSQIFSEFILPSYSRSTNPPYCNWSPLYYSFHHPFLSAFADWVF